MIHVLEQDVIAHLFTEFLILDTAEFKEGIDVIPVFFVVFAVRFAHAGELVGYFLGDVVGDLLHEAVVLQGASGHVQRKIRAVDDAF